MRRTERIKALKRQRRRPVYEVFILGLNWDGRRCAACGSAMRAGATRCQQGHEVPMPTAERKA